MFPARPVARWAASACLLLLGACASVPPGEAVARRSHPAFEFAGRLSVSDGARAASARVEWRHHPDGDQWVFVSPLGQILARLERTPQRSRLETADGRIYEDARVEALVARVLGVDVPMQALAAWAQAAPPADAEVRERDMAGRPMVVIDRGWRIEYPVYESEAADAMPRRIEAEWGEARLKLLAEQWTLP